MLTKKCGYSHPNMKTKTLNVKYEVIKNSLITTLTKYGFLFVQNSYGGRLVYGTLLPINDEYNSLCVSFEDSYSNIVLNFVNIGFELDTSDLSDDKILEQIYLATYHLPQTCFVNDKSGIQKQIEEETSSFRKIYEDIYGFTPTERTLVRDLKEPLSKGRKILIKGYVSQYRELKKFSFIILRDRTGYCSIFVPKDVAITLSSETVIEVIGIVKFEPQSKYDGLEIVAESIKVVSEAETLPFPISREEDAPPFNTLNLFRPLTLRKEKERCIFKIQSEILTGFRQFMRKQDFIEINSPKISAAGLEGGSEMFEVDYFENKMYLTQSPQFYKQMMVGVYERVYEVGKVYRAEGSNTNKHLAEYVGLDFEMSFIDSVEDVMNMEEEMFKYVFKHISKHCKKELDYLNIDIKFNTIPRFTYEETINILNKEYNFTLPDKVTYAKTGMTIKNGEFVSIDPPVITPGIGLNTEAERLISEYVFNKTGSEFVFITKYPLSERPFYAMPSPEGENKSETFELLYKGMEITSGGARIHNYQQLKESITSKGINPDNFESYLMPFKYGMPPHGGCGIGLERVMMKLLNLDSVQESSLIPRTREKFIH